MTAPSGARSISRTASPRGTYGALLLVATILGLAIASYLVAVRFLGGAPACVVGEGCDTVAASPYATFAGIPVALFGFGASVVIVACAAIWWRRAHRRALQVAYGLLLFGTLAVAYLTYLELFVIHAICIWCVTYAILTVTSLLITGLALRRT